MATASSWKSPRHASAGGRSMPVKTRNRRALCCRTVLNITLTAGGASVASYGGRAEGRAAFPLAESSRLTGIESRDDAPRRMVMRHGGGTECERSVFRAKRKRERVSATPIERHQEVAEAMSRGAEPLGGAAARRRKRAGRGYMLPYLCCRHS